MAFANGSLCGTVHDASSGAVVQDAGIFFLTTSGSATGFQGVSDAAGAFCIGGIPAGTYDVEVRHDHYVTAYVRGVVVVDDVTGVDIGVIPSDAALLAPRPNPARHQVEFRFRIGAAGPIRLDVFDMSGRRVRGWGSDAATAGERAIEWDLRDAAGRAVPAGLYLVRLHAAGATLTRTFSRIP